MPSLGAAAAASGWCPVCHQTGNKHTSECSPEKRKARGRREIKIISFTYGILFVIFILIPWMCQ